MIAMTKFVARIDADQIGNVLINILVRIRLCFDKDRIPIRTVGFELFGKLAKFGKSDAFCEQIQSNFVAMLLHANDESDDVCRVSFMFKLYLCRVSFMFKLYLCR